MQDKIVVGPDCSRIFDSERKAAEDAAKEAQQTITQTPKFDISASVEVAIRQRLPTIALTPPSKDRWNIDVFWCARSDPDAQSANFTRVLHQGLALGALAQRGDRMGNERLGQIRVRTLTENAQNTKGRYTYYNSGNKFLYDQGDRAEQSLVSDLATFLNQAGPNKSGGKLSKGPIEIRLQGRPSKWYLSLFICEAGTPPEAAPSSTSTTVAN